MYWNPLFFNLSKLSWIWGCLAQNRPNAWVYPRCKDGLSPGTAGPTTDKTIPASVFLIAEAPQRRCPLSGDGPYVVRGLRYGIPGYLTNAPESLILVRIRRFAGVPAAVASAYCCCLVNEIPVANKTMLTPPKTKRNLRFLRSCCMMNRLCSGYMFVAARRKLVVPL